MSQKKKFPRADAIAVAKEMVAALKSCCVEERLVIAGSLRRGKAFVGDVEVLLIPKFEARTDSFEMFAHPKQVSLADIAIDEMIMKKQLNYRLNVNGSRTYGPKNKYCVHKASGIPVDFFTTDERCWHVALVIRTGGKMMNLLLTNGAIRRGRTLHAYGSGISDRAGNKIDATTEAEVFSLCGERYRKPHLRP